MKGAALGGQALQRLLAQRIEAGRRQHQPGLDAAGKRMEKIRRAAGLLQTGAGALLVCGPGTGGFGYGSLHGLAMAVAVGDAQACRPARGKLQRHIHAYARRFLMIKAGQVGEHSAGALHVLFAADAEHGQITAACQVSVGKPAAGKHSLQLLKIWGLPIQGLTIGGGGCGDVFRTLHAALDLKRGHAGLR